MSCGFLLAAAVPIFAAISNARPGLMSIFIPKTFGVQLFLPNERIHPILLLV